jgi:hypothetical protein
MTRGGILVPDGDSTFVCPHRSWSVVRRHPNSPLQRHIRPKGDSTDLRADLNGDGVVNLSDLGIFASRFGMYSATVILID